VEDENDNTVRLIEAIMTIAEVIASRDLKSISIDLAEALKDLNENQNLKKVLKAAVSHSI
jgi:hypothetical protein